MNEAASVVHVTRTYAERGLENVAISTASEGAAKGVVRSATMEVASWRIRVKYPLWRE